MNCEVLSNIPRHFTALAEWLACMVYLFQCPRRLIGRRFAAAAGAALILQGLWLVVTGSMPLLLWMPCMAIAVGIMFLTIFLCGDIPAAGTVYCTIRAFLLAEFMASLEWQLYFYAVNSLGFSNPLLSSLSLAAVYGIVCAAAYQLERRSKGGRSILTFRLEELWSPVIIALTAFCVSNLSFVYSNTPFSSSSTIEIFNIRTLVDLSGVATLYAYHTQRGKLFALQELDAIQNILQNQYIQYHQSKESIDVINRKYHDLKHQIAILRAEQDSVRRNAFLDEMEEEIKTYEAQNKTGNPVLDTVLTGKSLYCTHHQIELTCIADGALLSFMDVMDICTIFGNALDNAIEYELTIPKAEKRLIHLAVSAKKSFLLIHIENYFEGTLRFENGLPLTTKSDRTYHGFGMKSIRQAAEKYAGTAEAEVLENWFQLRILIPLPPA